jgi:hypothetical protein
VLVSVNLFGRARSYSRSAWCHEADEDYFEVEAGDPLHEPGQGCLIWHLGAKDSRTWADGDLAVVEFRAPWSSPMESTAGVTVATTEETGVTTAGVASSTKLAE